MELRKYQVDCLRSIFEQLKNKEDSLSVLPTASGKTIIFSHLIKKLFELKPYTRALILVDRVKLINQTIEKLRAVGVDCDISVCCGSLSRHETSGSVVIANIATLARQPVLPDFHMAIVDEAHDLEGTTRFENVRDRLSNTYFAYFTATPYKYGVELEQEVTFRLSMKEMIEQGWIVPPVLIAPEEKIDTSKLSISGGDFNIKELAELITEDPQKLIDQCKDAIARSEGRRKVLYACTTKLHAEAVTATLKQLGERAVTIHSGLSKKEHKQNTHLFEKGNVRNAVSVSQLSTGYDYPAIECIVLFRPTRSANLYVQTIGRGLRKSEGKKDCLVLDYGGCVEALGHPDKPLLIRTKKDLNQESEEKTVICPSCRGAVFYKGLYPRSCSCGYEFTSSEKADRLKNLSKKAWRGSELAGKKLAVLGVNVDKNHITKSGKPSVMVTYHTPVGSYREYFIKDSHNKFLRRKYWDYLAEELVIHDVDYVILNEKGFVSKRIYDDGNGDSKQYS